MAKELQAGGYVVGTEDYLKKVHKDKGLDVWKKDSQTYKGMIEALGVKAAAALEELCTDLITHQRILRYSEASKRNELALVAEGLDALAKLSGKDTKKDSCISLLQLKHAGTKAESKASDKEILGAADFVEKGRVVTKATGIDLVTKAMTDGPEKAAGKDVKKFAFFMSFGKRDKVFYKDLGFCLLYRKAPDQFKGKSGKAVFGKDYTGYLEKKALGMEPLAYDRGKYAALVTGKLQKAATAFLGDVAAGIGTDDFMVFENRERLGKAAKKLREAGAQLSTRLETNMDLLRRLEDFDGKVIGIEKTGWAYSIEAQLKWEKGWNVFYLTVHVFFQFLVNAQKRKEITDGFLMWNKSNCTVFGGQKVDVVVEVRANEPRSNWVIVGMADSNFRGVGFAGGDLSGAWGWTDGPSLPKVMILGDRPNTLPNYEQTNLAKHELGHMLGLGDMYEDAGLGLKGVKQGDYADLDQYFNGKEFDMVMNYNGQITDNDIEMVIRAFQTGKRQNYQTQDFGLSQITEVSDVLGR